jgi:putative phosphonate transport system ATP-binding protein
MPINSMRINVNEHNNDYLLKVQGLTKIYGDPVPGTLENTGPVFNSNICPESGSIVACADICFELFPGEVLGIVGESGSGKSTVIRQLYFDIERTSGSAFFSDYGNALIDILDEPNQSKRFIKNHLRLKSGLCIIHDYILFNTIISVGTLENLNTAGNR